MFVLVMASCAIDRGGLAAEPGVDAAGREAEVAVDSGRLDVGVMPPDAFSPEDDGGADARLGDDGGSGDAGDVSSLCDAADPDLLVCLAFDGDLRDGSMYRNDASGAAHWATGRVGQALEHGVGDTISLAGSASLVAPRDTSMEMFLRPDALPASGRVG